jgi:hypothetical protein
MIKTIKTEIQILGKVVDENFSTFSLLGMMEASESLGRPG